MKKELLIRLVAKTSTGMVRELNEDNFIATGNIADEQWVIPAQPYINNKRGSVLVITDGMGGANAGEVASGITVESVGEYFRSLPTEDLTVSSAGKHLKEALFKAHRDILRHENEHPETEGMGATVVIAAIIQERIFYCWSGDSRCYLFRKGRLTQLTNDHSYVQSLVDKGKITKEQAFLHPESNIITQNLGDKERLPDPGFGSERLSEGDLVLLCSDGLNSMLTDVEIEEIINAYANDIQGCTEQLVEMANKAGGSDNITVILAGVGDTSANRIIERKGNMDAHSLRSTIPSKNTGDSESKKKPIRVVIAAILLIITVGFAILKNPEKKTDPPEQGPLPAHEIEADLPDKQQAPPPPSG